MQEEHLILTPLVFATHLVRALEIFAQQRNAVEAAIAREQAASLRELRQWERLSDKFLSDAHSGTPYTGAQDDSLDSGGSLGAGDDASWPVFRAPPGLRSSAEYHQISKEESDGLPPCMRSQAYYTGRARRQRNRRYMIKYRGRSAQAGQNAPYQ